MTVSPTATAAILWGPLLCAAGTFGELPLEAEEVVEVAVVPDHRGGGPRALEPGGDGVHALAASEAVLPA